ncbi:hypothetical protein [Chryseobacterium wanjuense]
MASAITIMKLQQATRIGVAYAQEDAFLPWRFFVKGNKYVSKPNTVNPEK